MASETITIKFRDASGNALERTFSRDVHGDEFEALADEFKQTNASRLIVDEGEPAPAPTETTPASETPTQPTAPVDASNDPAQAPTQTDPTAPGASA